MTTQNDVAELKDWTPSDTFRSVGRLTSWLMLLGTIAALGSGIGVGVVVYHSINSKTGGAIGGVAAGLVAGLIALTPYMVVVALLDLVNAMSERLSWIADFMYEQAGEADAEPQPLES